MSAGKGDTPRKVDGDKYRANYEAIFPKSGKWCSGFTPKQYRQMYELPQSPQDSKPTDAEEAQEERH